MTDAAPGIPLNGGTHRNRGVSELIGFVIVVGLVIMLLAILQTVVVPIWDSNVEADHSQQVQADMVSFHGDVVSTATDGGTRAAPITLGARYGGGGVLLRPPPVTGTISTTEGELRLEGVDVRSADRQAGASPNPEQAVFGDWAESTRLFAYTPDYSQRDGPTTRYEHTTLFEDHGGETLRRGGSVVDGRTIRLVALSGDFNRGSASRVNLAVSEESVSTRTVPLGPGSGSITLSTTRSAEFWEDELADSPATLDSVDEDAGTVTVGLAETEDDRNYRLQLASVHLGDGEPESPEVAYVFVRDPVVGVDEPARVEARDRFGNPVPNADLSPFVTGCDDGESRSTRTDDDGQLRLSCSQPGTFTFFEGQDVEDTITVVGAEDVETEPPAVTAEPTDSDTERFETLPRGEREDAGDAGTLDQTQITVSYSVEVGETAGSELDRVELRLFDLRNGEELLSATTHSYQGEDGPLHDGRWVTPWFSDSLEQLEDNHRVEIVAVNANGQRSLVCEIDGGGGC